MITIKEVQNLFAQGFDCSQIVVSYFAEELGISDKIAKKVSAAFGGGVFEGEMCGAYSGALIVIGLKYGHYEPDTPDVKNQNVGKVMEFKQKFKEKYDSCTCKDLLGGLCLADPDDMRVLTEKNTLMTFCPKLVVDVIEILEEVLISE